jgi:hypothetical protein
MERGRGFGELRDRVPGVRFAVFNVVVDSGLVSAGRNGLSRLRKVKGRLPVVLAIAATGPAGEFIFGPRSAG